MIGHLTPGDAASAPTVRRALRLLLDAVPGQHVHLGTGDAAGFHEKPGFAPQMQGMGLIAGHDLDNATRRD